MTYENEFYIKTSDAKLANKLSQLEMDGIKVFKTFNRCEGSSEIVSFLVEFGTSASLIYFAHWLTKNRTETLDTHIETTDDKANNQVINVITNIEIKHYDFSDKDGD